MSISDMDDDNVRDIFQDMINAENKLDETPSSPFIALLCLMGLGSFVVLAVIGAITVIKAVL